MTPPSGPSAEAAAFIADLQSEQEKLAAKMQALKSEGSQYPRSPGLPGTSTFSAVPLANLGIAPGATDHAGFVVQYGTPRKAHAIKFIFPPTPAITSLV